MSEYQAGQETKKLILDTCRKLFYEKGYKNTTIRDISKATHTNVSAVSYHFDGKEKIRSIIVNDILHRIDVEASHYTDDFGLKYIVAGYILWYIIYNDEKFKRFYCEYVTDQDPDYSNDPLKEFFVYLYKVFGVSVPKPNAFARKYELQTATALMSEKVCCDFVLQNTSRYTYYEMSEMNIKLEATLLGIPEEIVLKTFRQARRILKTIDMSIFPTDLRPYDA